MFGTWLVGLASVFSFWCCAFAFGFALAVLGWFDVEFPFSFGFDVGLYVCCILLLCCLCFVFICGVCVGGVGVCVLFGFVGLVDA